MYKYFIFLIFLACSWQSSAMMIEHGGVNALSKNTINTIIEKSEKLGIKDTSQITTIRSWWNGNSYEER